MSIVKEVAEVETMVVEKTSRTKKLERETADLRKGLEILAKFVYKRLQTADYKTAETTYDSQVYRLFTAKIECFEDLHFCVEPDVGLGFTQILIHADDADNFQYTRDNNIILYSVNGTVVYKQPIGFAMDVITKAKMEKKEDEAVIFGLLDTWFDESEEEDENEEEEAAEKEEEEEERIASNGLSLLNKRGTTHVFWDILNFIVFVYCMLMLLYILDSVINRLIISKFFK